jgi:hypothetical protein
VHAVDAGVVEGDQMVVAPGDEVQIVRRIRLLERAEKRRDEEQIADTAELYDTDSAGFHVRLRVSSGGEKGNSYADGLIPRKMSPRCRWQAQWLRH